MRLICLRVRLAIKLKHTNAGWSSSVARWAHNPEVAGSNPAPATKEVQVRGLIAREAVRPFDDPLAGRDLRARHKVSVIGTERGLVKLRGQSLLLRGAWRPRTCASKTSL